MHVFHISSIGWKIDQNVPPSPCLDTEPNLLQNDHWSFTTILIID